MPYNLNLNNSRHIKHVLNIATLFQKQSQNAHHPLLAPLKTLCTGPNVLHCYNMLFVSSNVSATASYDVEVLFTAEIQPPDIKIK